MAKPKTRRATAPRKFNETEETRAVERLLRERFPDYPAKYPPRAYRYNPASIRVRLVSRRFSAMDRGERWDMVNPILEALPEETQQDIMILLLYAPDEVKRMPGNWEFENPSPSGFEENGDPVK